MKEKTYLCRTLLNKKNMNTTELETMRKEAEKTILSPPCQFTIDELQTELIQAVDDFNNGRTYTMEEMRAIHPPL
jgi:hypothetical protein